MKQRSVPVCAGGPRAGKFLPEDGSRAAFSRGGCVDLNPRLVGLLEEREAWGARRLRVALLGACPCSHVLSLPSDPFIAEP